MKLNLYIYHFVWMYYNIILLKILSKPFEMAVPVLSKIGLKSSHLQLAVVNWGRPSLPVQLAC